MSFPIGLTSSVLKLDISLAMWFTVTSFTIHLLHLGEMLVPSITLWMYCSYYNDDDDSILFIFVVVIIIIIIFARRLCFHRRWFVCLLVGWFVC